MVAISLYRGNLHKVPDVPRRWTAPRPTISAKDFQTLLRRRSRALSRLQSSDVATTSASNPNPSSDHTDSGAISVPIVESEGGFAKLPQLEELKEKEGDRVEEEAQDDVKEPVEEADVLVELKKSDEIVKDVEKVELPSALEVDDRNNAIAPASDNEKRIKEVKERLEILNEKKHSLVQVLKQILSAEEQLKRQNSTQGNPCRPPLPLHVDTGTDSGSMTRINTPRMGSDGNPCGEADGGAADDGLNHNLQYRQLPRMSSTSPSGDSQPRKLAANMMPHSYRTTLAVAGSPSRFAPTAGQGPSSVSASGTNYVASSPSPAASGGTSVFRDARLPSPWN